MYIIALSLVADNHSLIHDSLGSWIYCKTLPWKQVPKVWQRCVCINQLVLLPMNWQSCSYGRSSYTPVQVEKSPKDMQRYRDLDPLRRIVIDVYAGTTARPLGYSYQYTVVCSCIYHCRYNILTYVHGMCWTCYSFLHFYLPKHMYNIIGIKISRQSPSFSFRKFMLQCYF